jgi:hypothetical protein
MAGVIACRSRLAIALVDGILVGIDTRLCGLIRLSGHHSFTYIEGSGQRRRTHRLFPPCSEHTHEIASATRMQSSTPNANIAGNFCCSISGPTPTASGTWSAANRRTVIQNRVSFQKSRKPMMGSAMANPAANDARPQCRTWSKKPSSSAITRIGPLMDQTFAFLHFLGWRLMWNRPG